ncbi:hypothetical protein [Micromonospora sp. NPDC051296]|uniref:hypothetical protein n=1 Tax=Micromonospora sp. NPDC051296 TaxID=3155046 RepID=UPI00341B724E
MATDKYEELDIPPQFQTFAQRNHVEYRQTPAGITLYLGLAAAFLGLLFSTAPKVSEDGLTGYLLLGGGAVLLIASRVLHLRKRRREEELYRQYLEWKKDQEERPEAGG